MGIGKSTDPKSAIQQVRDAISLDNAEGYNLDQIANNLGFPRPIFGWQRDDDFRAAVRQLAVQPKTPVVALHKLVELILGPDRTKIKTFHTGEGSPAILTGTIAETYAITASTNDQLYIRAQGAPGVTVTLTTGGAVTAATIAADINATDELQVAAEAVDVTGVGTVVQLTATGLVVGVDSVIEIDENLARTAHTTLGLATVAHGHDDIGAGSYLFAIDEPDYISDDEFPQVSRRLVVDEHGPTEETLEYRFLEPQNRIVVLTDTFAYAHSKYLPYEGTELTTAVSEDGTTISVRDTTGFPTLAAAADEFMGILINRGGGTEEYIKVSETSGADWTLATGLQFDHEINESVERAFDADTAPTLASLHAAGALELNLTDSSIFPKADFTVIVERGTDREETFWISENDITGATSGTANTLIIDGTQQATAPSVTAYEHASTSIVEPAQFQLKACSWRIIETRATGEVLLVIARGCLPTPDAFQHAYLHEEIEPVDVAAQTDIDVINITADITAGDRFFRVDIDDLYKLWGGPGTPPGPREQAYENLRTLNRSAIITDGTNSEERMIVGVKESTFLIQQRSNGVLTGYDSGDTYIYVDDINAFTDLPLNFQVRVNRGGANEETVVIDEVDTVNGRLAITGAKFSNEHCTYDDINTPANAGGAPKELIEVDSGQISLITDSAFENNYLVADTPTVGIINTPNFLYDTGATDSFNQGVPTEADNLQDAGWLLEGEGQSPQDGRYWGYYVSEDATDMPRSISTMFSPALALSHPEAINEIPAPTELIGWCTALDGTDFEQGDVASGKSFLVIADARRWPGTGTVAPFPYPIRIDDELYNVENIQANPTSGDIPNPFGELSSTYQLGVIQLETPTRDTHLGLHPTTGRRGTNVILRVEQLLLEEGQYFPATDGAAFLDFGYANQEFFEYTSRTGNVLVVDDLEFQYQHPANKLPFDANIDPEFMNSPGSTEVTVALKDHSFDSDGYDHPIYLPSDPTESLLGISGRIPGMIDLIRAAGIKLRIQIVESPTEVISTAFAAPEEAPVLFSGVSITNHPTDVDGIRLTPVGPEDKAFIWCYDSSDDWKLVEVSTTLDCLLDTTGAGGLQTGDTYSANSGYQIFLIAKALQPVGSQEPALIAADNGTSITPTLPAGYTHYSKVIGFASTDATPDLLDFQQYEQKYYYKLAAGPMVESGYKSDSDSNTDCSAVVPYYCTAFNLDVYANCADATAKDANVKDKQGSLRWQATTLGANDEAQDATNLEILHVHGTAPEVDVFWSAAVTSGDGVIVIVPSFTFLR